jgi:hypothetical protein
MKDMDRLSHILIAENTDIQFMSASPDEAY